MPRDGSASGKSGDKDRILSNVALLYYGEGLTQSEIAKRMDVSRATIVNMLREGRERGIVEIRVDGDVLAASTISRQLCSKFGLADAYVSRSRAEGTGPATRSESLAQLARVAGMAILDVVEDGNTVGVAWGETIKAVSEAMPFERAKGVEVCQMIGSMVSDRVPASEDCAIKIANRLGAVCFTLHAPAVLSSAALAETLRTEPTIAAQLQRLEQLDVAIFSVGNTAPDTHLVAAGIAKPEELTAAVSAGAKGIVCCRYLDAAGHKISLAPDDQIVAVDIDHIKNARKRLLIASGDDRAEAVLACLSGGMVSHLCVDEPLANLLVS